MGDREWNESHVPARAGQAASGSPAVIAKIIETTNQASGHGGPVDPSWAGILLALENGFRLHRLIDPAPTPADSLLRAVHRAAAGNRAEPRLARVLDAQVRGQRARTRPSVRGVPNGDRRRRRVLPAEHNAVRGTEEDHLGR